MSKLNQLIRLFGITITLISTARGQAVSEWVHPGPDGKLVYKTTDAGDRIMDFSYAGYMGGGVAIPDVAVKETIKPSGGEDDSATIQSALDEVAKLPLVNGFRGAVLMEAGTYPCSTTINITAAGVVLRGSGIDQTTINLTGRPHLAISTRSGGFGRGRRGGGPSTEESSGVRTSIADSYVPSGAMSFNVRDASGFAVGDTIVIDRPVTQSWIKFMHMDDLTRDGRPQTWMKAGSFTSAQRTIAGIEGHKITLDVPLADSFDGKYLNPPGTTVSKISPPAGLSQVGIENFRITAPPQAINHTEAHYVALRMNGHDCWARNLQIEETMDSVGVGGSRITLQNVNVIRKAMHQGASKPAEFAPNGSQVLMDRCSVDADNVWWVATGAGVPGPIVVLNCTFKGNSAAESHQRWSTGILYDNCSAPDGEIELRNRGSMGSGHGWSMGWGVVWNCVAKDYIIQNPPGSINWLIGSVGENKPSARPFGSGPMLPGGDIDASGTHVTPQSLYLTQLKQRLGAAALKNIGYDSDSITPHEVKSSPRVIAPPDKILGVDLALRLPVNTSSVRNNDLNFGGEKALDGDEKTYWAADEKALPATIELDTAGGIEINAVKIGEALGQRVQQYKVEGQVDSAWKILAQGTTIAPGQIDRFQKVTVWKVRLTISKASDFPAISEFGLYLDKISPPKLFMPVVPSTAPSGGAVHDD